MSCILLKIVCEADLHMNNSFTTVGEGGRRFRSIVFRRSEPLDRVTKYIYRVRVRIYILYILYCIYIYVYAHLELSSVLFTRYAPP